MLAFKVNLIKTRWVPDYDWSSWSRSKHYVEHMGLSLRPFLSPLLINMIFKLCITMLTEPANHLTATPVHLWVYEYTVWIHAWGVSTPSSDKLGISAKHAVSPVNSFTHWARQEVSWYHSVSAGIKIPPHSGWTLRRSDPLSLKQPSFSDAYASHPPCHSKAQCLPNRFQLPRHSWPAPPQIINMVRHWGEKHGQEADRQLFVAFV